MRDELVWRRIMDFHPSPEIKSANAETLKIVCDLSSHMFRPTLNWQPRHDMTDRESEFQSVSLAQFIEKVSPVPNSRWEKLVPIEEDLTSLRHQFARVSQWLGPLKVTLAPFCDSDSKTLRPGCCLEGA